MDPVLRELIAAGAPGDEVAVIARLREGATPPAAFRPVARFGTILTGRAKRGALAAIHADPAIASLKAPRIYSAELDSGEAQAAGDDGEPIALPTDRRRPPGLPETGTGTVVAVIDWGLDFAHPDFRRPDGRTRLIALWDQRVRGRPSPYGYGVVHDSAAIDAALLRSDPFASLGYHPGRSAAPQHGTHVMAIAAGNRLAKGPAGVAPEAKLCFVHLGPGVGDLGNSIDLLEAIHFVTVAAGKCPLAINLSIGRHAGPHDGTLLVEQAIDWLIENRPGTVVVQSTGNYYARDTHMTGRLREARTATLPFTVPRSSRQPVTLEFWYESSDTMQAAAFAPDGARAVAARGEAALLNDGRGGELGRLYHRAFDPNNGDHLIALVLRPGAPVGEYRLEVTGLDVVDGRWHAWIERDAACPRCQPRFVAERASGESTTGSICNALRTIAVGAYDAHAPEPVMARFSSVGPTRDGRPKPLLVAPGVRILSARSRRDPTELPGYVRMSGTSMAAPHVTGTAALMLQAAGARPIAEIRRALFSTLAPAPDTSTRWGYGLLDVGAAVTAARRLRNDRQPPLESCELLHLPAIEDVMTESSDESDAGPLNPPPDIWTKGRDQTQPTPERRVLSRLSDAQLRAMLGEGPPLVAVAMREDAETALATALDPDNPDSVIIGWPGRRLDQPLWPGDLIVHRSAGGRPQSMLVTSDRLMDASGARALGADARAPGRYAAIAGPRAAVRLIGPEGLIVPEALVIRSVAAGAEVLPPNPATRPTLRQGSRGPAVIEAQTRLNAVHARRLAAGQPGLDRCPLSPDGVFGANTRAATIAFQRAAFSDRPADWDGVIGPRTWAALLSDPDDENRGLPTRCDRLDERTIIDQFDFNSATVLPRHQPTIIGIVHCIIASEKSPTPVRRLTAIGHTDPVGSDSDNLDLGMRRASAVRGEIFSAYRRVTGRAPGFVVDPETRGEREPRGTAPESRRVEVVSDFAFVPGPTPKPASSATIEFVLDDDGDHRVDGRAPVATALMFGLWDRAYDTPAGNVRNAAAEANNFVGADARRFYIRVRDPAATTGTVAARWRTLTAARANDDAPASQVVTLTETAAGSKVFVSRALMIVVDDTDADQATHSGLTSGPDAGPRRRGQSNHRLRRAALDGFVQADYTPAGGRPASVVLPVFERRPEARLRLPVRVVNWGNHATQARIDAHFARANTRWAIVGLRIDPGATVDLPIPPAALDATGRFPNRVLPDGTTSGGNDSPEEIAALTQLAPLAPDNTITVVFVRLNGPSAYVTTGRATSNDPNGRLSLGGRYFVFMNPDDVLGDDSLAHEFHHAIYNRFDFPADAPGAPNVALRPFFPFNTNPMASYAPVTPPDVRLYRRVQNLHSPDPNNDPPADNVINWTRRRRTQRFNPGNPQLPPAIAPADRTTGNVITTTF